MTRNEKILTAGITIIVTMWVVAYLFSKEINKNNAQTIYELKGENAQLKKQATIKALQFDSAIAAADTLERELSTFREQLKASEQTFNNKLNNALHRTRMATNSDAAKQLSDFIRHESGQDN